LVYFKNHLSSSFSTKNPKNVVVFAYVLFTTNYSSTYLFLLVETVFFVLLHVLIRVLKLIFFKEKDIFFSLVSKLQTPNLTCEARTLTLLHPSDHFSSFFLSFFNSGKQKLAHLNISIIFFWELYGGYDFIFLEQLSDQSLLKTTNNYVLKAFNNSLTLFEKLQLNSDSDKFKIYKLIYFIAS